MTLKRLAFLLVSLVTPLALIGTALRILLSPIFYTVEYRMPYFPADTYGFSREERLVWAGKAVEYLVNRAPIAYLGDLTFADGSPLYNARELAHMQDVKGVVQAALLAWGAALGVLLVAGLAAWRGNAWGAYLASLRRGGWWMIGLAWLLGGIALIGILINPDVFWQFFTLFHQVFFEGDSWLFYDSDTLIRLFPIRFWQDAFLWAAVLALGGGAGLAFGMKGVAFRKDE